MASGVEPCLRYISRRLGRYGSDLRKDAVFDRLVRQTASFWFVLSAKVCASSMSPTTRLESRQVSLSVASGFVAGRTGALGRRASAGHRGVAS